GLSSARQWQFRPGDNPFVENGVAEAEQLGRSSDGVGGRLPGLLDQFLLLDEAPEIRLVDQPSGERFDRPLQLEEGEAGRHQLEYDGAILDLGTKPRDARRQDAAMVRYHRRSGYGHGCTAL